MKAFTPRITEKSYRGISEDSAIASVYTFTLKTKLNKDQIKKLVEKEYSVHVTNVRTVHLPAKARRFKNIAGTVKSIHKALVTIQAGETIAAFDVADKQPEGKE